MPGQSRQNGDITVTSSLKCYVKRVTELELEGLVGI